MEYLHFITKRAQHILAAKYAIFVLCLLGTPLLVQAQERTTQDRTASGDTDFVQHPDLRAFLLSMKKVDQSVREELIDKGLGNLDSLDMARQAAIDEANQAHLQDIIDEYGWPDRFMVGRDGVDAAFLVAQHADPSFRRRLMPTIRAAYQRGDLSGGDYALFVDRVLVDDSDRQRYGTQAYISEGRLILYPIEDRAYVDARRQELGLEPMADYVRKLEEMYGMKAIGNW